MLLNKFQLTFKLLIEKNMIIMESATLTPRSSDIDLEERAIYIDINKRTVIICTIKIN